jgi:hypothetical protein
MFRYVLSLTFAVGLSPAATMTARASCDGVTTVGTNSAFCDDGRFMARAGGGGPAFVDSRIAPGLGAFGVGVSASPSPSGFPPVGSSSAFVSFEDDYMFTVFGGTGAGSFFPCFGGISVAGSSVFMSLGGIGLGIVDIPSGLDTNCPGPGPFPGSKPFIFGVPEIVHISIMGSASTSFQSEVDAFESFDRDRGILFFDPAGNPSQTSPSRWWRFPSLPPGPCCVWG